eukprot:8662868-Pyramimonas_sp.AAC.1
MMRPTFPLLPRTAPGAPHSRSRHPLHLMSTRLLWRHASPQVLIRAGGLGGAHMAQWPDLGHGMGSNIMINGDWPDRVRGCTEAHQRLRLVLRGGDVNGWSRSTHLSHPPTFVAAVQTVLFATARSATSAVAHAVTHAGSRGGDELVDCHRSVGLHCQPAKSGSDVHYSDRAESSSSVGGLHDGSGTGGGDCRSVNSMPTGFWSLGRDELEHIFQLAAFPLSEWCQMKRSTKRGEGSNEVEGIVIAEGNDVGASSGSSHLRQHDATSRTISAAQRRTAGTMTTRPSRHEDAPAAEVAQELRLLGFGPHWGVVLSEMREAE